MEQYIPKSALVAEIEKRLKKHKEEIEKYSPFQHNLVYDIIGKKEECSDILSFIDTLEVKEVDLEKEANECWNFVFSAIGWDENSLMTMDYKEFTAFAKHFFGLGLKAQV